MTVAVTITGGDRPPFIVSGAGVGRGGIGGFGGSVMEWRKESLCSNFITEICSLDPKAL